MRTRPRDFRPAELADDNRESRGADALPAVSLTRPQLTTNAEAVTLLDEGGGLVAFEDPCRSGRHDRAVVGLASNGQCRACQREAVARYRVTKKGRVTQARYNTSEKGRARTDRGNARQVWDGMYYLGRTLRPESAEAFNLHLAERRERQREELAAGKKEREQLAEQLVRQLDGGEIDIAEVLS